VTGEACTDASQCGASAGAACVAPTNNGEPSGWPGGYCTGECDDRDSTFCGQDAVCLNSSWLNVPACYSLCSAPNQGQSTCREGYVCNSFDNADGGPSTSGVCQPSCAVAGEGCGYPYYCGSLGYCESSGITCGEGDDACEQLTCACSSGGSATASYCWDSECVTSCPAINLPGGNYCNANCFCASSTCSLSEAVCCDNPGTVGTGGSCSGDCDCESGFCNNNACVAT
jgi:hypothetical protein